MPEEQAVETVETAAPQPGVEETGTVAPQSPTNAEVDLAAELERTRTERENFKRGMLKAKGKLPEEEEVPSNIDEIVQKKVEEAIYSKQEAELEAREKALTEKLIKENRELKLATQNRSQINTGTGQGASIETTQVKDNYFSDEQLADLKKRGLDPEKVKANIQKYKR